MKEDIYKVCLVYEMLCIAFKTIYRIYKIGPFKKRKEIIKGILWPI